MIQFNLNPAAMRSQQMQWHTRLLNAMGWYPELDAWCQKALDALQLCYVRGQS